ncbi:MAG: DEAD/DEAH box helicase family protein [Proteobacteria bacterium]|nr:DEAD/DEAH box helicase family protein [Pseudomonadota bacterium]
MTSMIPKSEMTEEDIKLNYITPALHERGWKDKITMETAVKFTEGRINLRGNAVSREAPKKADYLLYQCANHPIAVVEAKDNNHSVGDGIQQAMMYAQMLDLPFAYSSNGDGFIEHDFLTGTERELALNDFPKPDELFARYRGEEKTEPAVEHIRKQSYYSGQKTWPPRYYQRIAINRTVEAISNGQKRLLLVMATGTGKTYTAFQIVWRLLRSGVCHKVLYLADRNNLVDQSIQQDFAPLEKTIHKINFAKEDKASITSYELYFSLYHQLADRESDEDDNDDEAVSKLASLFSADFFDLIIVDECHRGSAKKDSNWRKILDYFSPAAQLGMTATPKETKYISNIDYFGEPIYSYSLREGIDDGFLAPFKVINIVLNVSDGWRPTLGQTDTDGDEIEDRIYNNIDYDRNIVLKDRDYCVAEEITKYLKHTDRMAKTIVFCQTEEHAERMRRALIVFNRDKVKENPDYIVRITGSDKVGKSKLDYFIAVDTAYPVIATTSKLLSTGTDCKMTKLIVIDQMVSSMTEFKQMIGRGTRLRPDEGKTHFYIMDFRGVSRLFADPDWDGPIEQVEDYDPDKPAPQKKKKTGDGKDEPDTTPHKVHVVERDGCRVEVIHKTVSVYTTDGKLLRQENIIDYTKTNLLGEFASLESFIKYWTADEKKEKLREMLHERGIDLEALKRDQNMADVDDFDFVCHLAFDKKPLTRRERAENAKQSEFLNQYHGEAKAVLEALIDKYMNYGITQIEDINVLKIDPITQYGKPARIVNFFGGKSGYLDAVRRLEQAIYGIRN